MLRGRRYRAAPRSCKLLRAASVENLRSAVHPVLLRLARIPVVRAGVDLGGQRDRGRGEDQRGDEGLEHSLSPLGAWAARGPIPRPLVSGPCATLMRRGVSCLTSLIFYGGALRRRSAGSWSETINGCTSEGTAAHSPPARSCRQHAYDAATPDPGKGSYFGSRCA